MDVAASLGGLKCIVQSLADNNSYNGRVLIFNVNCFVAAELPDNVPAGNCDVCVCVFMCVCVIITLRIEIK